MNRCIHVGVLMVTMSCSVCAQEAGSTVLLTHLVELQYDDRSSGYTFPGHFFEVLRRDGDLIEVQNNGHKAKIKISDTVSLENAQAYFTAEIKKNRKDTFSLTARAEVFRHTKDYDAAIVDWNAIITLCPAEIDPETNGT